MKLKRIYEPRGNAREYSALALNLYSGCSHGCAYCYAPAIRRMSPAQFRAAPRPYKNILADVESDASALQASGDRRTILLCFTSDPYQPCEAEYKITRRALEILGEHGLRATVLTKNGKLAERDFDLLKKYDFAFGQTIVFADDLLRRQWEPRASSIPKRFEALVHAKRAGIRTWVSVEPVIIPEQMQFLMDAVHEYADVWKIGKLNHDKEREAKINWTAFLERTLGRIHEYGMKYYIKDELWKFATPEIRARYPKCQGVVIE